MSQHDFQTSAILEPQAARPVQHPLSVRGIAIAKRIFHGVGMPERGQSVVRQRLSRHDLMPCMAHCPPLLIGMEACAGRMTGHGAST
jgi:hypothetical protein